MPGLGNGCPDDVTISCMGGGSGTTSLAQWLWVGHGTVWYPWVEPCSYWCDLTWVDLRRPGRNKTEQSKKAWGNCLLINGTFTRNSDLYATWQGRASFWGVCRSVLLWAQHLILWCLQNIHGAQHVLGCFFLKEHFCKMHTDSWTHSATDWAKYFLRSPQVPSQESSNFSWALDAVISPISQGRECETWSGKATCPHRTATHCSAALPTVSRPTSPVCHAPAKRNPPLSLGEQDNLPLGLCSQNFHLPWLT